MSNFYDYFKENMEGLGLPAPRSLFGSVQMAVANASIILSQIDKFGKAVTIGELIGAGTLGHYRRMFRILLCRRRHWQHCCGNREISGERHIDG